MKRSVILQASVAFLAAALPSVLLNAQEVKPQERIVAGKKAAWYRGGAAHTGFYPGGLGKGCTDEDSVSVPLDYKRILFIGMGQFLSRTAAAPDWRKIQSDFYALDTKDGSAIWQAQRIGDSGAPPVVVDGKVYATTGQSGLLQECRNGSLIALDAGTGKALWKFASRGAVPSPPAIVDDVAYFGSGDKNVYAVDCNSGKKLWSSTLALQPFGPVSLSGGIVFALACNFSNDRTSAVNTLHALDAKTGKEIWSLKNFGFYSEVESNTFEIEGDSIIAGTCPPDEKTGDDKPCTYVASIKASTGEILWKRPASSGLWLRRPSIRSGIAVFLGQEWEAVKPNSAQAQRGKWGASQDYWICACDPGSGEELWKTKIGMLANSISPVLAEGRVFMCTREHAISFDAKTGEEQWRAKVSFGCPVYARKMLYVVGNFGRLLAYDALTGELKWESGLAPLQGQGGSGGAIGLQFSVSIAD